VSARPIVTATLNARLRPLDRGELYEDPLDEALRSAGLGEVTGGGTQLAATGEIDSCDLEIELAEISERTLETVRELLERLGAPNGSRLVVGEGERRSLSARRRGSACTSTAPTSRTRSTRPPT
jgi:hypothetical protein